MPHPPYSYLDPSVVVLALDLARELRQAADDVDTLANGGTGPGGTGGRAGDKAIAVREWIGPHRSTFEALFDNETDSARTTVRRLQSEARAWAWFWALATNARNDRIHDEAMGRYEADMRVYRVLAEDYRTAIQTDPATAAVLYPPQPPTAPQRPPPVASPAEATDFRPTG